MKKIVKELNEVFMHETGDEFENKLKSFTTEKEYIEYCIELCNKHNIKPESMKLRSKDLEESKRFREIGNLIYTSNPPEEQLKQAYNYYTKALVNTPVDSEDMPIIYANRSAASMKLKRYEDCLKDIDRCLKLNYPEHLKVKILLRKTECLSIVERTAEAEECYKETAEWIDKYYANDPKEWEECKCKLEVCYKKRDKDFIKKGEFKTDLDEIFGDFNFKQCNKEAPMASDAVELQYSEKNGRHLVATRDIKPGEILIRESPFCAVYKIKQRYTYCWRCLKLASNLVPCDSCQNVVFCSEECKAIAWKEFHDIECGILLLLLELKGSVKQQYGIGSLRAIIKGIKEYGSIANLMEEVRNAAKCKGDPRKRGFSEDGQFHSDKFKSFYSLESNIEKAKILKRDLHEKTVYSVLITFYLATETNFFGKQLPKDWSKLLENEQVIFIGSLILRHIYIMFANCLNDENISSLNSPGNSITVYPFSSFINHSCFQNVEKQYRENKQLIYAVMPIKKGQQLLISYGVQKYNIIPYIIRQIILKVKYCFSCKCVACKESWSCTEKKTMVLCGLQSLFSMHKLELVEFHNCDDASERIRADFYNYLNLLSKSLIEMTNERRDEPTPELLYFISLMTNAFEISQSLPLKR